MTKTIKYLPWLLSVVLAVLLALSWHSSQLKLEQKKMELASLREQYDTLNEANDKCKQLAYDSSKRLRLANQPEIQVHVSFRKAFLSSGIVARVENLSSQIIAMTASVERPSSGQKSIFDMTLDRGQSKEIGEREGWAFVPGDTIVVNQPDHKSRTFRAP